MDAGNLMELFQYAPWAVVAAAVVWPDNGIIALWIKRGEKLKLAELERDKTHEALKLEAKSKVIEHNVTPQIEGPKS